MSLFLHCLKKVYFYIPTTQLGTLNFLNHVRGAAVGRFGMRRIRSRSAGMIDLGVHLASQVEVNSIHFDLLFSRKAPSAITSYIHARRIEEKWGQLKFPKAAAGVALNSLSPPPPPPAGGPRRPQGLGPCLSRCCKMPPPLLSRRRRRRRQQRQQEQQAVNSTVQKRAWSSSS